MYSIFGEAAYFGSITELAGNKFLKANLVGKMVLIDDDMKLEGLKVTSFLKSLATSETPITVQAKGKQGHQVKLKCRAMCFANGAQKSLCDKTDGWERRLIILSAKAVPTGRVNDSFLSEKPVADEGGQLQYHRFSERRAADKNTVRSLNVRPPICTPLTAIGAVSTA